MKTITREYKIYKYTELSKEAKEKVKENFGQSECFWTDDTIKSFQELFNSCDNISLDDYSLGDYQSYARVSFTYSEIEEMTGKRAMAWIENNLLYNIRVSYYGQKRKELRQYGKYYYAGKIKPCPFTGYCSDDDFLESLLNDIKEGSTLKDAFENLASVCQKLIQSEIEHQYSEEYAKDTCEANDYIFLEDGTMF